MDHASYASEGIEVDNKDEFQEGFQLSRFLCLPITTLAAKYSQRILDVFGDGSGQSHCLGCHKAVKVRYLF